MRTVTVVFHYEDGSWWVETDDFPGFVAGAATFDEARELTQDGLEFESDDEVELDEQFDDAAVAARRSATSFVVSWDAAVVTPSPSRGSAPNAALRVRPTPPSRTFCKRGGVASSAP